ncbi:MAG: sulfite exporter TauE/SafE family protein [Methylococcus sp.]|nr:sulfite exporter TauE/SafE family protein [Methylococcus sp.]
MTTAYAMSGLLVGFLVGLTGVGGGSLMTPLLVFMFGFAPKTAVGTDLLFAAITKSGGVLVHHRSHRSVEWKIVAQLALGSIPAALTVIYLLETVFKKDDSVTALITTTLGIALIFTGLSLLLRKRLAHKSAEQRMTHTERFGRWQGLLTVLVGAVLGILVTLSSVGAGALGTVALLFLYPRLATVRVVGTDLAHAIPLTAVAGLGHLHMGNVDFTLLGSLLVGSLPGIYLGSHLSARIPEWLLRPALASLLLLIGCKFVL